MGATRGAACENRARDAPVSRMALDAPASLIGPADFLPFKFVFDSLVFRAEHLSCVIAQVCLYLQDALEFSFP